MLGNAEPRELFSGCGGLSLGLESAGFERVLANELSPMAAESFAYNFFDENWENIAKTNTLPTNTLWLNSNFPSLKQRLRENPYTFPAFDDERGFSDLPFNYHDLKGKLVVGSIVELNRLLEAYPELSLKLKTAFNDDCELGTGLDLVSGGPPCQSFSMAGLRQKDSEKNTLPWEFAKFVKFTQPKIALLENVTGILRAFKNEDGEAFHAWYEVAKAFASLGYVPLCLHVNARLVGVPQNRPRFIMIAVRHDHLMKIKSALIDDARSWELFDQPLTFFNLVNEHGIDLEFGHLGYRDVMKEEEIYKNSFLSPLIESKIITVKEALDDLKKNEPNEPSLYVKGLNSIFKNLKAKNRLYNHEFRSNSELVKSRFRIYQVLQHIGERSITKEFFSILRGEKTVLSDEAWQAVKNEPFLIEMNKLDVFSDKAKLEQYLCNHPTKKQTQKALSADAPAPAALSIPDDACHYDLNELRVLTVREMARIQSFPDNFVFRSKVTTGGQMRKFEVPQYTQVGNAVPPLLALKLGKVIKALLP